jgi:hypothetical protein
MPGDSTCVGSDGVAFGEAEPGAAGAVAVGALGSGARAADAWDVDGVEDRDAGEVREVEAAPTGAVADCAPGALVPQADKAAAAISGTARNERDERRTEPSIGQATRWPWHPPVTRMRP